MPNHVINMIEIEGDPKRIAELREAVKHDDIGPGSIDFDKVIPRPPELNIESGSRTKRGIDAVKDFFAIYHLNHPDEQEY